MLLLLSISFGIYAENKNHKNDDNNSLNIYFSLDAYKKSFSPELNENDFAVAITYKIMENNTLWLILLKEEAVSYSIVEIALTQNIIEMNQWLLTESQLKKSSVLSGGDYSDYYCSVYNNFTRVESFLKDGYIRRFSESVGVANSSDEITIILKQLRSLKDTYNCL